MRPLETLGLTREARKGNPSTAMYLRLPEFHFVILDQLGRSLPMWSIAQVYNAAPGGEES